MLAATKPILLELKPRRHASRVLYTGGAVLVLSGLVHTLLLAASGFEWEGSVSWRKPIVFGLSFGLLLATIGWVLDRLTDRPRIAGLIAWALTLSSVGEVALITLQTWRGVPSHFNVFEDTNGMIFGLMGMMVAVASLCLVVVLVWAIARRPDDRLVSWAVIGGMILVMGGLGIGQWLIELGNHFAAINGIVPETVKNGAAGVPKFPHAVAFHGIQLFILGAIALRLSGATESRKMTSMRLLVVSYSSLLVLASVQAVLGVSPTGLSPWTILLACAGIITLWVSAGIFRLYLTTRDAERQQPATAL